MQLVDRNGAFRIPLNMNMTYKTICIFIGCIIQVPYHLIEKTSLNKMTIAMRLRQKSVVLMETQESLQFKK